MRKYFPFLSKNSIFLTFFLDNLGVAIIFPIFTPLLMDPSYNFFKEAPSASVGSILLGLLIAAFPSAQFFGAPLIGDMSDQIGRKKAFAITITGSLIGYILLGLAIDIRSLWLLFISRMLTGLFSGNLTICLASLVDISQDEAERTKNFGTLATIGGLSFILSVAIGGVFSNKALDKFFTPSLPFWIIAALFALNLILMLTFFEESHRPPQKSHFHFLKGVHNIWHAWQIPHLKWAYLTFFFFMTAWITSMQFMPSYLIKYYSIIPSKITYIFLGVGLAWGVSNFISSRFLSNKVHPWQLLKISLSLLAAFIFFFIYFRHLSFITFLPLFYLCVMLAATSWANCLSNVSMQAEKDVQGKILGINQSFSALAAVFGPITGGILASQQIRSLYMYTSILCVMGFIMITIQSRSKKAE